MTFIDPLENLLLEDVMAQVHAAEASHRRYASVHEAFGVLLEEVVEFWEEVRKKKDDRDPAQLRAELIDIMVVCWRAARSLNLEDRS